MPLVFTGPPDVVADLKIVFRSGLPQDVADEGRDDEDVEAFAELMSYVEGYTAGMAREIVISTAQGVFLSEHGHSRGVERTLGEPDPNYRIRVQTPPSGGTTTAVTEALVNLIGTTQIMIIELPRDSMYLDRGSSCDRGRRMGGGRGVVIAVIPASAGLRESAKALLRAKISAGKIGQIEEYS